ncbi:outer membrane lipoprotein-sorting protein [Jatrophihabitans sp. GAS493]|uniref:LolA family protein n=1 Tax=Jatrophihabitans sp. GAS493 TaxID=1907575 RepID=UPI000BB8413D|nr:transcriptional regulator [Jatrophihabitans sp. GAS493]SOD74501.1 outer membrane lipoprotein-sorting protein [Jatrophihabitans sp. GAS493]
MSRTRRWLIFATGLALLISVPAAVGTLPVAGSSTPAAELLGRINSSAGATYSGYAESNGGLALPVTQQYSVLANLFGDQTQMRVWSRGPADWRVDSLSVDGETDLYSDTAGTWTWDYETNQVIRTTYGPNQLRLPVPADLLPSNLARRLLSEATSGEVSRLPTRRIAQRSATGLRLTPAASASTIDRVDVWADEATGIALRVEVYSRGEQNPSLTSAFLDFRTDDPSPDITRFIPPPSATVRETNQADIASAVNRFGQLTPPTELAGLPRNTLLQGLTRVGTYGRGVTELAAIPLPVSTADGLREQLKKVPGIATTSDYQLGVIGPVSLLLGPDLNRRAAWLLVGTVDPDTLRSAIDRLPTSLRRPR